MRSWFLKKIHISWHITGFAAGVLAGAALAIAWPSNSVDTTWLVMGAALMGVVMTRRSRWLFVVALLAGLLCGGWRGLGEQRALRAYGPYFEQHLQVSGVLRDDISQGPHGDQRFELQEVRISDGPILHGKIWVSTPQKSNAKRGDRIVVSGVFGKGFGNTTAAMSRASVVRVEHSVPGDIPRVFRDWFAQGIRHGIDEPQASLGIGYLTGQRSTLPTELDEQLRIVGLTHAVVASGYNLTILVAFTRNCLMVVSKYTATLAAGLLICCFMLITGFSPSMTRAGLVSGISLGAWYYGRTTHPLVLLPVAAAITVLLCPAYIWGDIGWSLSFAAFAGIVIISPLLRRYFWTRGDNPPFLLGILVDTAAAQLVTLPIILFSFGQYAVYALLANMLVLPLVPLAMALTFFTGVVALALPGLVSFVAWPATAVLKYMIWVIGEIAGLPDAQTEVVFTIHHLVGSYLFLLIACFWLWRKTGVDFRDDADRQNNV